MAVSPAPRRPQDRILDYFNIQPGELRPTLGLAAYLLLGIAAVISLKAAADSLFLKEFDARRLPLADLSITVLVAVVVSVYLRLSNRLPQGRLISGTQTFLAASLFLLWGLLRWGVAGMPALLYVWVGVFTVLIPSQVWSLAGSIFTTRQAKRLFSVIGSGGIVGAALGGQFTSQVGPHLGTANILLAAVGLVLVCALIASRLSRGAQTAVAQVSGKGKAKASIWQSLQLVRETSLPLTDHHRPVSFDRSQHARQVSIQGHGASAFPCRSPSHDAFFRQFLWLPPPSFPSCSMCC